MLVKLLHKVTGVYKYQIRTASIVLEDLPEVFDGLRIVHLSDIHAGSLRDYDSVLKGIDSVNELEPDIVFFTGDLVNKRISEISDLLPIFGSIESKYGVYTVAGNHDYPQKRFGNAELGLEELLRLNHALGWNLLVNENHIIEAEGEKIAIIGVENQGKLKRHPRRADIDKALAGTETCSIKMLLTHDPFHWKNEILGQHLDVDITFSGHTHGFQIGAGRNLNKISPARLLYRHWDGLYKEGDQYLFVNRGFGFHGMPSRIGMPPEISFIKLYSNQNDYFPAALMN
ncbi:MAG: metallophosphoesterase [Bacteroidetes bacterium]|nr:metallophosphoesterase [Bacteroidota bacterium]MBU1720165.1 metallophosphoesterase [Bacteroidota bacterium]